MVKTSLVSFMEFLDVPPRKSIDVIKRHRDERRRRSKGAPPYYWPFLAAIRRAVSSLHPLPEIAAVVEKQSDLAKRRHYAEVYRGFQSWWSRVEACGVPVARSATWCHGGLVVPIKGDGESGMGVFAVEYQDGSVEVVLPYFKQEKPEDADLVLRIMEHAMGGLVAEASPMVLDARRSKELRLSDGRDRGELDTVLASGAEMYVRAWQHAA